MNIISATVSVESGCELVPMDEMQRRASYGDKAALDHLVTGCREIERVRPDMRIVEVTCVDERGNSYIRTFKSVSTAKIPEFSNNPSWLDELREWAQA